MAVTAMITLIAGVITFTGIILILVILLYWIKTLIYQGEGVQIKLIEHGEKDFSSQRGGTLLEALHQQKIFIPAACGGKAMCGECKVQVMHGGGALLASETTHINRKQEREHFRLACQVKLKQNLLIRVPEDFFTTQKITCRVAEVRQVATFMKEITLAVPSNQEFQFKAGQYLQVHCPPYTLDYQHLNIDEKYLSRWQSYQFHQLTAKNTVETTRSYSLGSDPKQTQLLRFIVRLATPPPDRLDLPTGIVSSYLFGLKVNDPLTISGPFGYMTVEDSNAELVLIGGGAGMAPLYSIIVDQLCNKEATRHIHFYYGARSLCEVFYFEELNQLQQTYENFKWTLALSNAQPEDNWKGATGFIHEVALEDYLADHSDPDDIDYYLCGPPPMISACLLMLDEQGVEPENIRYDKFG